MENNKSFSKYVQDAVELGLTDPRDIAEFLRNNMPEDLLFQKLMVILQSEVRIHLNRNRRNNPIFKDRHSLPNKTTRADRIRNHFAAVLAQSILTDDGWKELGNCTYSDLCSAAKRRFKHAEDSIKEAKKFERLAIMLEQNAVATVGELTPEQLAEVV